MQRFRLPSHEIGGSQSSGVYTPMRVGGSQDSARSLVTSQPASMVSSFEDSPQDGGRSQARFQEFVSRTRHLELLEIVNELRSKVTGLEEKIDELKHQNVQILLQHSSHQHRLDDLLHHSVDEHSCFHSLDEKVQRISKELQENVTLLGQMHSVIEEQSKAMHHANSFISYREISVTETERLDCLWEQESDLGEGMSLGDYLTNRSNKTKKSPCPFSREETVIVDSHMTPPLRWD